MAWWHHGLGQPESRGFVRFIEKLTKPVVMVVAALVFFLAVDGFLLYRYQVGPATVEDTTATPETTASENAGERTDATEAFVHRAAPQNIADNSTYVDHPLTNEN